MNYIKTVFIILSYKINSKAWDEKIKKGKLKEKQLIESQNTEYR